MRARRVAAVALRQFYLYPESATRVVPLFAWVAIDITLWGFISRYLNSVALPGYNFIPALLGAVLLWDFLARVLQGVSTAFLEDVWSRNFLNMFATPLQISEYICGLVITAVVTSPHWASDHAGAGGGRRSAFSFVAYGAALVPFWCWCCSWTGIALGHRGQRGWCCGWVRRRNGSSGPARAEIAPFRLGVYYPVSTFARDGCRRSRGCCRLSYVFETAHRAQSRRQRARDMSKPCESGLALSGALTS